LLERYAQIQPLLELRADWFDRDRPAESLQVVRRITDLNPGNAWAWREQAILYNRLGEFPAALEALEHAEQLEPASIALHQIRGDLLLDMGQTEQARACYKQAIKLSVDSDYAIDRLLQLSYTTEQKREALAFIRGELTGQVVHGDGLWSYQSWAAGILEPEELLAELRHAHEVRPDLWHSSSALSRQLLEMGRTAEARGIAESAAERFPLLPRIWLDLARCRRLDEDADGEAEALHRALEINPNWSLPLLRLSEHHERRGDYARSRDVLRDYLQRNDDDSRVHGYLAAALWHLDEHEEALHHIRKAVELSPSYSWAWERLHEWSSEMDQDSLALEVARALVVQEPGNVSGWLALAEQLGPCEESLQTLKRAIELEPRRIESHDRLMQHLVRTGHFDEARNVTADPVWEGNVPVTLRVNIPWIRYRQGMVREAIKEMRQLLETEPRQSEAWRMLAVWAEKAQDKEVWLEASRRYAALLPTDADAQNYLAGALAAHELNDEAMASYQRSLQLAPDNEDSALSLFDLQFAAEMYEEATQTLAVIHTHHPHGDAWFDAREVQLHCHSGDKEAAVTALHRLVMREANGNWPLNTVISAMVQAGWLRELDNALASAIKPGSTSHASVGRAWVKRLGERGVLRGAKKQAAQLFTAGDAGIEAIDAMLDAMIEKGYSLEMQLFIWQHRDALHRHTTTWCTVGYFYTRHDKFRKVVRWMADWRERTHIPAWALNNLAIAQRELGYWKTSAEVCARGLQGEPGDYSHKFHLWLAIEHGLQGDVAAMEREMEAIDIEELSASHQYIYHLMLALHTAEQLRSNSADALDAIRVHLRNGLKAHPAYATESTLVKLRHRVMKRITRAMGSFPFNLYFYWRLL
jgi:tetratricopeptide (TPR) repeat protein